MLSSVHRCMCVGGGVEGGWGVCLPGGFIAGVCTSLRHESGGMVGCVCPPTPLLPPIGSLTTPPQPASCVLSTATFTTSQSVFHTLPAYPPASSQLPAHSAHPVRVHHGERLSLQRRVLRLGKPPRRWRRPGWAAAALWEPPEVTLTARYDCAVGAGLGGCLELLAGGTGMGLWLDGWQQCGSCGENIIYVNMHV